MERLKDFCDFVRQEYTQILGYANVRCLSWLPDLEGYLKFTRLLFFMSEIQCPKLLKHYFENNETELWISCAHSHASLFHDTIKIIEGDDNCATESALLIKSLLLQLETRHNENFIPHMVKVTAD